MHVLSRVSGIRDHDSDLGYYKIKFYKWLPGKRKLELYYANAYCLVNRYIQIRFTFMACVIYGFVPYLPDVILLYSSSMYIVYCIVGEVLRHSTDYAWIKRRTSFKLLPSQLASTNKCELFMQQVFGEY